jgi:hypothetical protein
MDKRQFVITAKDGTIEAVILIRGTEFYCYERLEDAPKNLKEAQELYSAYNLVEVELSKKKADAQS